MPSRGANATPTTAFVLSTLEVGGSERKTVRVVNALHSLGYAVSIAYLNPPSTLIDDIDSGIPIHFLNRTGKFSVSAMTSLRKVILSQRVTRLVSINLYPTLYTVTNKLFAPKQEVQCLSMINTGGLSEKEQGLMRIYAPLLRRCDRIFFGCDKLRQEWISRYRIRSSQAFCLYNGVDTDFFCRAGFESMRTRIRSGLGISCGDLVVGTVGKLTAKKNQADLVKTLAQLRSRASRKSYAIIVGDGPERDNLVELAKTLAVEDCCFFVGEQDDVRPYLAASDVFVLPSQWETFSNAALEAMSMGLPCVLSSVGGAGEMIQNGFNGFLYSVGDIIALTEVLLKFDNDLNLAVELGKNARMFTEQKFSFQRMVKEYQEEVLDCRN